MFAFRKSSYINFIVFLIIILLTIILLNKSVFADFNVDLYNKELSSNKLVNSKKQVLVSESSSINIKDFLVKAKKQEGLLNVYSYNNQFFIELPKDKLNKLFYSYLSVSKGIGVYPFLGGLTLPIFNYDYSVAVYFDIDKNIELKDNSSVKLYLKLKNLKYRNDSLNTWADKLLQKSYSDSLISVINSIYYDGKFYINADNFLNINFLPFSKEFSKTMVIKPFKIEDKEIQSKTLKRTTNFVSSFEIKTTTNDIIEFTAVPSFHDKLEGKKLGPNTIWTFYIDGIKITHVGDLGHLLKDQDLKIIGTTDILIAPIGGGDYTINFKEFLILMDQLKSIVSIPVHYKTKYTPWISDSLDIVDFPAIEKLDDYILNLFTIPLIPKIYLFPEEVWDKIPEKIS